MENRLEIERRETKRLELQALELGFEIPRKPGWWQENEEFYGGKSIEEIELTGGEYLLTAHGKAGAQGLIQKELDAIRDRRIRWACQIIAALTGVGGIIIALIVLLKK